MSHLNALLSGDELTKLRKSFKKSHRFSCGQDLFLLREVIATNPFEEPKRWDKVAENLSLLLPVTKRCCRERTNNLIKTYLKNDMKNLISRGTDEEVNMKMSLLQDVVQLHRQGLRQITVEELLNRGGQKEKPLCVVQDICTAVKDGPLSSCSSVLGEDDETNFELPPMKKLKHSSLVGLLSQKQDQEGTLQENQMKLIFEEMEIQKMKVAIKERNTTLEEEKFALEAQKVELEANRHASQTEERMKNRNEEIEIQKRKIAVDERNAALVEKKMELEAKRLELQMEERQRDRDEEIEIQKRKVAVEERNAALLEKRLALKERKIEYEAKRIASQMEERQKDRDMFLQILELALKR